MSSISLIDTSKKFLSSNDFLEEQRPTAPGVSVGEPTAVTVPFNDTTYFFHRLGFLTSTKLIYPRALSFEYLEIFFSFQVALKVIPKVGKSARDIASLRHECKLQRELNHPNIVRMLVRLSI